MHTNGQKLISNKKSTGWAITVMPLFFHYHYFFLFNTTIGFSLVSSAKQDNLTVKCCFLWPLVFTFTACVSTVDVPDMSKNIGVLFILSIAFMGIHSFFSHQSQINKLSTLVSTSWAASEQCVCVDIEPFRFMNRLHQPAKTLHFSSVLYFVSFASDNAFILIVQCRTMYSLSRIILASVNPSLS